MVLKLASAAAQSLAAPQAVRPAHARYRAGELGAPTIIHTLVGAPGGPMSCLEPPIGKPPDAIKNMIVVDGRLPCVLDGFTRSVAR